MPGIFISYRRKDAGGYAGRLHGDLVRRYGQDAVFMDIDSISGGVDFRQRIHDALDSSDIALALIGEHWTAASVPGVGEVTRRIDAEDDLVRREVAAALRHEKVTVVPVLVDGAAVPEAGDLPADLASLPDLQVCPLRNGEWRSDVDRICRAVDAAAHEAWSARAGRRARAILRSPRAVTAAVLIMVALAVVAFVGLGLGGEDGGPGCVNQFISPHSRERLSAVAGSAEPAVDGSVYYGSCGSRTWAMASFPNGSDDLFVESDQDWVDLGPVAAEKCVQVPSELLDAWHQDDC